jgi:hypothetical protein
MENNMKQARPKHLGVILAVAVLGIALAVLAGCTMMGDNVTGVGLDGAGPTSCVKQCNDFFKGEYENEQKLHLLNVEACQMLAQPAKGECLMAEDARHTAAMDALGAAKIECQNSCHRQGTGSAG